MTTIFKNMTLDLSAVFPEEPVASQRCQIGQPVVIADGQAVLRIALGADDLRNFVMNPDSVKRADSQIIEKLALLGSNFSKL